MNTMVIDHALHYEISRFYFLESSLLDHRKYTEWLKLCTEDIEYRMPLRVTKEKKDGSNIVNDMAFFEENIDSLTLRVKRFQTKSAWSDDPAPRTRHLISNVVIESGMKVNELIVHSCFQFIRNRGDSERNDQLTGERVDVLRHVNGQWMIASRCIYPDQVVLGTLHLNSFL